MQKSDGKTAAEDGRFRATNVLDPAIWFSEVCKRCACLDWCHTGGRRYDPATNECQVQAGLLMEVVET